ncbi:coiled-coil domain-containing protein 174-like [Uranotaenia lowii]|uniref:coiled-coil domain-containing protein 174-like n=1 Tax=Uranotaenia lowii TaxID=190385 RepID=UPI002478C7C4|nr:coiled-coil domain-containing protein 174-like [Uranotaenia lowii]
MNDPNKKIEIDKSSLLSLKAELLRKQAEVSRAKAFNSIDDFVPKPAPKLPNASSNSGEGKSRHRSKTDKAKADKPPDSVELEDSASMARSKKVLEAKARYYDRMVASGGALNSDENCLVMFNRKKQTDRDAVTEPFESSDSDSDSSAGGKDNFYEDRSAEPSENDWVEYIDFLGRSRRCRRKDLDECLRKDRQMARTTDAREGQRREDQAGAEEGGNGNLSEEEGEIIGPPVPSTAITEDTIGDRFREMREQWAKQESENLEKDSLHYSDVLFDEARQHGVGYYAFSTDREERTRQQNELDSIRESTLEAQRQKDNLRQARDRIIADRVKAAKARQRARLGLPPEPEESEEKGAEKNESVGKSEGDNQSAVGGDDLYDNTEEKKRLKAEAKARKKKEKEERKREKERAKHVRPWDAGKEQDIDKEWKPAKEWYVMSQEEWNEMKRNERIPEFAPPVEKPPPPFRMAQRGERVPVKTSFVQSTNDEHDSDEPGEDEGAFEPIGPLPPDRLWSAEHRIANNPLQLDSVGLGPPPSRRLPDEDEDVVNMPTVPPGTEDILLPEQPQRALFFTTKKTMTTKTRQEFKRRNYESATASDDNWGVTGQQQQKRHKPQQQQQNSIPIRNELSDGSSSGDEDGAMPRRGNGVEIAPPPTWDYYGPSSSSGGAATRRPAKSTATKNALEASIEAGLRFLRDQSDKGGPTVGTKNKWTSNADY